MIILDGCSLINPTYGNLNVEVAADNWAYINESITYESNFPYLAWWEQFNDPQLNHLIKKGLYKLLKPTNIDDLNNTYKELCDENN